MWFVDVYVCACWRECEWSKCAHFFCVFLSLDLCSRFFFPNAICARVDTILSHKNQFYQHEAHKHHPERSLLDNKIKQWTKRQLQKMAPTRRLTKYEQLLTDWQSISWDIPPSFESWISCTMIIYDPNDIFKFSSCFFFSPALTTDCLSCDTSQ